MWFKGKWVFNVEASRFQVVQGAPDFYESEVRDFMAPFVDGLIAATVCRGDAVLEVACVTGFATSKASRFPVPRR